MSLLQNTWFKSVHPVFPCSQSRVHRSIIWSWSMIIDHCFPVLKSILRAPIYNDQRLLAACINHRTCLRIIFWFSRKVWLQAWHQRLSKLGRWLTWALCGLTFKELAVSYHWEFFLDKGLLEIICRATKLQSSPGLHAPELQSWMVYMHTCTPANVFHLMQTCSISKSW